MRQFFFRAWDKEEKQMYFSPKEKRYLKSWFNAHLPCFPTNEEDIILMQYTGIDDNTLPASNYIFEGDIIVVKHEEELFCGEKSCICVLDYSGDGEFCLVSQYCKICNKCDNYFSLSDENRTSESKLFVIGNIFEHQHLLNKDK